MDSPGIRCLGRTRGLQIWLRSAVRSHWRRGYRTRRALSNGGLFAPFRRRPVKTIEIPELALVALIGASGSGKSTFARRHFLPTEVLSSDYCRALVSDDENNLAATNDAFEILHFVAAKRLAAARLTVADATNVKPEDRKPLIELARQYQCLPVAIVLNMPERICQD